MVARKSAASWNYKLEKKKQYYAFLLEYVKHLRNAINISINVTLCARSLFRRLSGNRLYTAMLTLTQDEVLFVDYTAREEDR